MKPAIFISIILGMILLLFIVGAPVKPMRKIGQLAIKILLGAIFLFVINTFGSNYDIHVPINIPTTVISGLLGIPGIAALVIIQKWII